MVNSLILYINHFKLGMGIKGINDIRCLAEKVLLVLLFFFIVLQSRIFSRVKSPPSLTSVSLCPYNLRDPPVSMLSLHLESSS